MLHSEFLIKYQTMKELLRKFENKRPEIVFEWKDSETDAEGWVVINSLRGGAAAGPAVESHSDGESAERPASALSPGKWYDRSDERVGLIAVSDFEIEQPRVAVVLGRKLAACGSRPPGYNSIQEERQAERPTQIGSVR